MPVISEDIQALKIGYEQGQKTITQFF